LAASSLPHEKGYQKNAWVLIAIVGVIGLIFGVIAILELTYDQTFFSNRLGQSVTNFSSSNPRAWSAIQGWERDEGTELFGFALLATAISFTAYRKGEKWAWYVFWYLPIYLLYGTLNTYTIGASFLTYLFALLLAASLAGLILPYRKFFPK
jgi:uncharacterized membrane protein HdeD (DUF308 family)